MKRVGRKSAAQTPSPPKERIVGSALNPKGSAKSTTSGKSIKVSEAVLKVLKDKAEKFNAKYPNKKVSVSTLKAVFRRGSGAYSSSHRPTITGGAPNSRTAWSYARVNKFLEKKAGKKVKKAYVQDDDLLAKGGQTNQKVVCQRCGWSWNTQDSDPSDKYVCHKCGHDNSWYYGNQYAKGGQIGGVQYEIIKTDDDEERLVRFKEGNYQGFPITPHEVYFDYSWTRLGGWGWLYRGNWGGSTRKSLKDAIIQYLGMMIAETKRKSDTDTTNKKTLKAGAEIMNENIALPDTYASYDGLKPILEKQGYEITPMFKPHKTLEEISEIHGVSMDVLQQQFQIGIQTELEHTNSIKVAQTIALHHLEEMPDYYTKLMQMEKQEARVANMKRGGELDADSKAAKNYFGHSSGAAGGLLVGKRHSEGGIKAVNKSTGQPLEMEGGEVVITRDAVSDETKREFNGKMMTNREILSAINESGGGVKFADGGDVPSSCACKGNKYAYGGKTMMDYEIVNDINDSYRKKFGILYPELPHAEAITKIFNERLGYEDGGVIEKDHIRVINKTLPSFKAFKSLQQEYFPLSAKDAYKRFLSREYGVEFLDLPSQIQTALMLNQQQLVDAFLNK